MEEWEGTKGRDVYYILVKMFDDGGEESFTVGSNGIDKIEKTFKSGMHANIPYLRVYREGNVIAELCQHNVVQIGLI